MPFFNSSTGTCFTGSATTTNSLAASCEPCCGTEQAIRPGIYGASLTQVTDITDRFNSQSNTQAGFSKSTERVMTIPCYNCNGMGQMTCPSCGGNVGTWHPGRGGKPEWSPCLACGGRRTITCTVCRGTGQLDASGKTKRPKSSVPSIQPPQVTTWWSKLPDRQKKFILYGLVILVILYFLSLLS